MNGSTISIINPCFSEDGSDVASDDDLPRKKPDRNATISQSQDKENHGW